MTTVDQSRAMAAWMFAMTFEQRSDVLARIRPPKDAWAQLTEDEQKAAMRAFRRERRAGGTLGPNGEANTS